MLYMDYDEFNIYTTLEDVEIYVEILFWPSRNSYWQSPNSANPPSTFPSTSFQALCLF